MSGDTGERYDSPGHSGADRPPRAGQEETRKFAAEQHKLTAEAQKLHRDRFWVPVLAIAAAVAAFISLLKSSGVL